MLILLLENQFQQTRGMLLPRYSAILMLLLKKPGIFFLISNDYFLFISTCVLIFYLLLGYIIHLLHNVVKQVWYWAGIHLVAERGQLASWLAHWWLSRTTGFLHLLYYCNSVTDCWYFCWFCYVLHWLKILRCS